MPAEENKAVVRRLFDAVNAGDLERSTAFVADDVAIHTPIPGVPPGRDGFRGFMGLFFLAFPEQSVVVHDVVAEADLVVVRHTHHVTHGGDFAGLPPSGTRATVEGLEQFRVADGKVAEMWHHDDLLGLMQQLGAIPGPASAPVAQRSS